jgi:carbonic anhydrase
MTTYCAKTFIVAVFAGALASAPALAQEWSYEGRSSPDNWDRLDPKFALCGVGKNQSPIDLDGMIKAELPPLRLTYAAGAREIVNNGHTVQVNYAPGSTIAVDGREFELKQFHFHSPSENKIGGKAFPLEAHLVHSDTSGNLAVVAVMFSAGAANAFLAKLWDRMPAGKGAKSELAAGLNVMTLLPASKEYYRFNGSLTTPPCSEGVRWLVMSSPVTASTGQVEQFSKVIGHPNNRPLQAVNARPVLR